VGAVFFGGILFISLFLSIKVFPAPAKEVWEDQGLEWYYDNLTAEDRQKIRQAMDYAIPRTEMFNDSNTRYYRIPLATDISSNMMGYNPSIRTRSQNIIKSKELLADVFGKRYENSSVAKANTTITNTPYFEMILNFPVTGGPLYYDIAVLIAQAFQDIGINTKIEMLGYQILNPRIFDNPPGIGFNHAHGGFDALCISRGLKPDPDLAKRYSLKEFVPGGENYQWIAKLELEKIINRSLTELDLTKRLAAIKTFQDWFYEWVPKSIIYQSVDCFQLKSQVKGFDPYNYGREPWIHNVTISNQTIITSAVNIGFHSFNPIIFNYQIDSVWQSNVHLSLTGRRGSYNLTHPVGLVAKNWTYSPDGLIWTVTLRKGLKFHDGSEVTADDVVFSYKVAQECPDSCWAEDMASWFKSSNDIEKIDNYTVQFTFSHFFPYITSQAFAVPILSKTQLESIAFADWKTHGTNLGTIPLLGCGPYEFIEYDGKKRIICHKATTWNASLMGHNPAASGGGIWWENVGPNTYIIKVVDSLPYRLYEFFADDIDLLDPIINLMGRVDELETEDQIKLVTYPDYYLYELGYNHYDPRWGLNPHDPREMYPEDYRNMPFGIESIDFPSGFLPGGFFIITLIMLIYLLNRKRMTRDEKH
jgi:ABC-type transport system substrate-binding protein